MIGRAWCLLACPFLMAALDPAPTEAAPLTLDTLQQARAQIVPADAAAGLPAGVRLERSWEGNLCRSRLVNDGDAAVRIREIVLLAGPHTLPAETGIYGEGFTMLSQTGGTLGKPADIGFFSDHKHYRIPQPADATTVYSLLTLSPPNGGHQLLAFTSCRRFSGAFRLRADSWEVVLDTENIEIAPRESWELEEFMFASGPDRNDLLARLAKRINVNHPPLPPARLPTGWCSWYCFGPNITAEKILRQIPIITRDYPKLRYIQIDDGYQPAMGDWLSNRKEFEGDIRQVCKQIKSSRLEPAIWVAPFIAEEKSEIFQQHPDWFIQDGTGRPLRSDRVSFGGWRCGPWYCLDGTHPEAQAHLENVFRTLHQDWGCTYFKLDANYWGALHGGRFHDPKATRIEAYRRGMAAVIRGAGDSFILGCNHPMWGSLGLIHGARCSMDIAASGDTMRKASRECFHRNWQNGTLWFNDPDVVLLAGDHCPEDLEFRSTVIYATGGMVLAGDDLAALPADRAAMLDKLLPPTGKAARFDDDTFRIGRVDLPEGVAFCLFNWTEKPQDLDVRLKQPLRLVDFWSGRDLGERQDRLVLKGMLPHSARLLIGRPVSAEK